MEDKIQLFQEWYAEQVVRWHTENTPKEVIAKECFVFGVQAAQQSFAPDVAMCEDCGKSPAMEGCKVCAECGL